MAPLISGVTLKRGASAVAAAYFRGVNLITPVVLSAPAGFDNGPSVTINKTGSSYGTTFDITTLIPAVTVTYYVDPANVSGVASDGNAGTARALPLRTLATALAKVDADQIRIINLNAHYIGRGTNSWNGVQSAKSIAVINESSTYRFLSCRTSANTAPTWTVNGTYANVYQTTISSASCTDVADANFMDVATWTDANSATATSTDHPATVRRLVKVASLAAVNATAGTWYNDGTITYARAHDDRNLVGDAKMLLLVSTGNNGRPQLTTSGLTTYVKGIDFIGGQGFNAAMVSGAVLGTVAFENCSFQCAGQGMAGGLSIKGNVSVYLSKCGAYNNYADGYNYHSFEFDAGVTLGTSPKFFEINCIAYGNGEWNGSVSTTDNATTAHDDARGIRLNGIYPDSSDRPVHDIDKCETWNLGCYIGPARDSAMPSVVAGLGTSTNIMWLDGCSIRSGANDKVRAETGSTIYYANMTGLTNAGGGTLAAYTP